jgi:hypothetical protein
LLKGQGNRERRGRDFINVIGEHAGAFTLGKTGTAGNETDADLSESYES